MSLLQNKTVVIVGAAGSLGQCVALQFTSFDMNIGLVADTHLQNSLHSLIPEIQAGGSSPAVFCGDCTEEHFAMRTAEELLQKFGKVDILIMVDGSSTVEAAENIRIADWDQAFSTSVKTSFLFCKALVPHFKTKKAGHIIHITSDLAKRIAGGNSLNSATRFAEDAFFKTLRKELRPYDVKLSIIYCGLINADNTMDFQGNSHQEEWPKNEDIANAVIFVASQPSYVAINEILIQPVSQDYP